MTGLRTISGCSYGVLLLLTMACLASCLASCTRAPEETPADSIVVGGRAGPVELEVQVPRQEMRTIDRMELTVRTVAHDDVLLDVIVFGAELGGFTVLRHLQDPPALAEDGAITTAHHLLLEPFLPGTYEVPSLELTGTLDGNQHRVTTEPIEINVLSVLDDTTASQAVGDPRGVVDLDAEERTTPHISWIIASSLALGAGVVTLCVVVLLRRGRSRPQVNAGREAMARLSALEGARTTADPTSACTDLASLLREYVANRFDERALSLSTSELADRSMQWPEVSAASRTLLMEVLTTCDTVRFGSSNGVNHDTLCDQARRFIELTGTPLHSDEAPAGTSGNTP